MTTMFRVISLKPLREFWEQHPDAERPLREWYLKATKADWANLMDVRKTFSVATDQVKTDWCMSTVFDIKNNKYRLIVRIRYDWKAITVKHVLTHAQYDRNQWKRGGTCQH